MTNPFFIIGTANGGRKTHQMVDDIVGENNSPVIDLNDIEISHYDYAHENKDDDFLPLMKRIVENHNIIVLSTPVYWYSVSSIMKVFIDRITDLLTIEKDIGRKLRGKKLYLLASGGRLPDYFEKPIADTCKYLGMEYAGCSFHCSVPEFDEFKENESEIRKAQRILYSNG